MSSKKKIVSQRKADSTINYKDYFKKIVEHSNNLFYIHDTNHVIKYISPQCKKFFGLSPEECKIRWTTFATNNPINEKGLEITEKTIKTGKKQPVYELELKRKDGTPFFVEVDESPLKDSKGKVYAIIGALRDITETKKTDIKLLIFKQGLENASEVVFITSIDGKINYVNKAFENIYGYKKIDVIGKNPRIIKSGILSKKSYSMFWKHILSKKSYRGEIINKTKKGDLITIYGSVNPILNSKNEIIAFLAIQTDITETKKAQELLKKNEENYRLFVEGTNDLIQSVDVNGNIIFVNNAWLNTLGYEKEDIPKLNVFKDVIHPESINHCMNLFENLMKGKDTSIVKTYFKTKKGDKILVEGTIGLKREKGKIVSTYGVWRDISEKDKIRVALEKRAEELEKFHKLSIGRELKMVELKNKITKLEEKLKQKGDIK